MTVGDIFTTAGIGGLIVAVVMTAAAAVYAGLTYWILQGGREEEPWDDLGWPFT
jgi:hypothetical protein